MVEIRLNTCAHIYSTGPVQEIKLYTKRLRLFFRQTFRNIFTQKVPKKIIEIAFGKFLVNICHVIFFKNLNNNKPGVQSYKADFGIIYIENGFPS